MHKQIIILISLFLLILPVHEMMSQNTGIPGYEKSWEIKQGYFKVRKNGKFGIVNRSGTVIVPCEFDQIWSLDKNGIVKVLKGSKIGLYNLNGVRVAAPVYDQIWSFSDGMAKVLKNGKIGYIDTNGNEIIPAVYNQIWSFKDGRARVLKNGKIGYIDKMGNEIIPAVYNQVWSFENGRARVMKNGKIGYIDDNGHEIIPPVYDQIWDFSDGRAKVMKNGKMGYIDENGREVIPPVFQQIWDFSDGKAKVMKNGKIGYIDEKGNTLIPPEFDQIWDFVDGKAKALLNGQTVWIDETGNVLGTDTGTVKIAKKDTVRKAAETVTVEPEYKLNDSIFNDSTVVRIWSDRIEIIKGNTADVEYSGTHNKNYFNRRKKRKFKGHWAGLNVGYNNLVTASGSFDYPDEYMFMEMNASKSVGVAANPWQQSIKLQRRGNIGLVTGIGFEWNNYRFDSQYVLTRDETTGNTTYYVDSKPIKRNKLTTIYMNVPLLLEFQIPTGKERYPFYISGGAIGGLRLGSHTKIVYTDDTKQKNKDKFNLTQWRYGVTARIGYRAINLFADYYFSPIFEKGKGPELYQVSAGIFIYLNY